MTARPALARAGFLLMLLAGACQCVSGDGSTPDAPSPDAIPDLPKRVQDLPVRVRSIVETADGQSLLFCAFEGEIGVIDQASLSITSQIEMKGRHPFFDTAGQCRITLIDEIAYAMYIKSGSHNGVIVSVPVGHLDDAQVTALPDEYNYLQWDDSLTVGGVQQAGSPGRVVFSASQNVWAGEGGFAPYFDLATGAFTRELVAPCPGAGGYEVYGLLDADRLLLVVLNDVAETCGGLYLASLGERRTLWSRVGLHASPGCYDADLDGGRLVIGGLPSEGWEVFSLDDGHTINAFPWHEAGLDNIVVWVGDDTIAQVYSGSFGLGAVSLLRVSDGALRARTTFPVEFVMDAKLAADGERLFVAGDHMVGELSVDQR